MLRFEIHSSWKKLELKEPLDDVMRHSGDCSDCQMALRTDDFVKRKFGGFNLSPTKQSEHLQNAS